MWHQSVKIFISCLDLSPMLSANTLKWPLCCFLRVNMYHLKFTTECLQLTRPHSDTSLFLCSHLSERHPLAPARELAIIFCSSLLPPSTASHSSLGEPFSSDSFPSILFSTSPLQQPVALFLPKLLTVLFQVQQKYMLF